jgi:hypothetical protein
MADFVSLSEFATIVGVSEPTLRKRFAAAGEDAPIEKRGKNGEAYLIPTQRALEWWKAEVAAEEEARAARQKQIEALQLDFLGDDSAALEQDVAGLTPGEMAAQLEAELKAIKIAELKGDLVRVADVELTAAAFMTKVADTLQSLPDRLRKRIEVSADVAEALERLVRRDLHELADAAQRIGVEIGAKEEAAADPAV